MRTFTSREQTATYGSTITHPTPAGAGQIWATRDYGSNSQYENVYLAGADGNLWVDHYDPNTGWSWANLGNPGTAFTSDPAVINYGSNSQYENVYLTGADGNMWVDHYDPNTGWSWVNQ
jgi:hypothetical protein